MTVSNATRKAGPFTGNGAATVFPFTFKVFTKADLAVYLTNAAGSVSQLTLDSDYSVALNADQNNAPGGRITYPITGSAMAAGYALTALGDIPYDQETDITNQGGFYPSVIEDMVDRSVIQIQQLDEILSRAIVVGPADSAVAPLPNSAARSNTILGFDATGNLETLPVTTSVGAGDLRDDIFIAGTDFTPGVSTVFPLSRTPGNSANVFVWWDDIPQFGFNPPTGPSLTFTSAPPADITKVRIRTGTTLSVGTPSIGSVIKASIAPGVIDGTKLDVSSGAGFTPAINFAYNPAAMPGWTGTGSGGQNVEGISVDIGNYGVRQFGTFGLVFAVSGAVSIPSTSTMYAHSAGIAGYSKSASTTTGAVALFGQGDSKAAGALAWGLNTVTKDNGFATTVWGYELDINVDNVNTAVLGLDVTGGSSVEPTTSIGIRVQPINAFTGKKWQQGLIVNDGSAYEAVQIGASANVASSGSMPLNFYYRDGSNSRNKGASFQLDPGGNMNIIQASNGPTLNILAGGLAGGGGSVIFSAQKSGSTPALSFYGQTPAGKQTVTGSKGGNAALASLMTALSAIGLFSDTTT